MMENDLNNKLRNFGNSLDDQLKGVESDISRALKEIAKMKDNPELQKLSAEFIANAKAGNPVNQEAYIKKAMELCQLK
jgi:hypothetical protein